MASFKFSFLMLRFALIAARCHTEQAAQYGTGFVMARFTGTVLVLLGVVDLYDFPLLVLAVRNFDSPHNFSLSVLDT